MFYKFKFNQRVIPGLMYYSFLGWWWKEAMTNPEELMSEGRI